MVTDPICLCGHSGEEHQDYAGRCGGECSPAVESPPLLPTPCARDYKDGEFPSSHARNTPSLGAISAYYGEGE